MAEYQYIAQAVDNDEFFKSACNADSAGVVRSELRRMGYVVDSVTPRRTSQVFGPRRRIKLQDLVSMCRRFSVMYGAGLSLMECLSLLARENESKKLSGVLQDIHDGIEQGSSVADAFAKHPRVFSPLFVNLLRAGETAGKFDYVLGQLAAYLEQEYDLRRRIRQALAYPLVVACMICIVVTAMMILVVPAFSGVYTKLGVPLPGPTIALIFISDNAVYVFPSMIALAAGLCVLYRRLRVMPAIKNRLDREKLSMAMIGAVYHKIVLLKFIRTLSVMLVAGIQLSDAIAIAEDVADNAVVSEAANMIQRNIRRGGTITEVMKLHAFFPQSIVHAFAAGERAGRLHEILDKVTRGIEQDVDDEMKRLVTKIEPLLMVFLSAVVGFIFVAIYLPIFDLMKVLRK